MCDYHHRPEYPHFYPQQADIGRDGPGVTGMNDRWISAPLLRKRQSPAWGGMVESAARGLL
jgi:hypothetical protein